MFNKMLRALSVNFDVPCAQKTKQKTFKDDGIHCERDRDLNRVSIETSGYAKSPVRKGKNTNAKNQN